MSKSAPRLVLGVNGFSLPIEAITESIGVLAKRRAGKSTTARRLTEQFVRAKQQVAIVDPKGDWWGLLYARDGKRPGVPFIVLGGGHGHIPLELHAGEIVARLVVQERVNVILDLSHFRRDDVPTFMTPFLETMYRLKADEQYRTPMMLIIDEADTIAPQRADREGERLMAAAVEDIVRRGGQRGMGAMLITQRTAELSKSALTQIGILIVLRTIAPQDLKAMDAWISVHGTPVERLAVRDSLPTMAQGEAFVWAPGWPSGRGIFERVQMALPDTFDSSSTPTGRAGARAPKHPARVNLTALQTRMAATFAAVKENDPTELKKTVAALRAEQHTLKAKVATLTTERDRLAKAVTGRAARAQIKQFDRMRTQIAAFHARVVDAVGTLRRLGAEDRGAWSSIFALADTYLVRMQQLARADLVVPGAAPTPAAAVMTTPPARRSSAVAATAPPAAGASTNGREPEGAIGSGAIAVLRAVASRGDVTREYVTLVTGFKKSTRNAYIQRLTARALLTVSGDRVTVTPAGRELAGPVETPPIGRGLVDWWIPRLPQGEREIFRQIVIGGVTDRETLTERTSLKKSTRNAYLQRLERRGLIVTEGRDKVRPHGEFDLEGSA